MTARKDREIIRGLAGKWMEFASLPVMTERKRLWKAVHDLMAERPLILFKTAWIDGCVAANEILCEDPFLRSVEQNMRVTLRQAEELGDDLVVEPYYRLGWRMIFSDYGVPVEIRNLRSDKSITYSFSFPIATPGDIARLREDWRAARSSRLAHAHVAARVLSRRQFAREFATRRVGRSRRGRGAIPAGRHSPVHNHNPVFTSQSAETENIRDTSSARSNPIIDFLAYSRRSLLAFPNRIKSFSLSVRELLITLPAW